MKKKIVSFGLILMVAVCSALVGMFVASSLRFTSDSKAAETFWEKGDPLATDKVVMPSLKGLADEMRPVVVNIRTTKVVNRKDLYRKFFNPGPGQEGGPYDDFFDFFERFQNNQPEKELKQRSLGSGFIVSQDGYILTNNHVISGADEILVSLSDDEEFEAEVIGRDENTDIALIKIDAGKKTLPYARLGDSDALEIGDWVIAIGNPFGFGHTLTQGIVSAKARVIGAGPYDNFIQTDAAINPGNSGGPLINMKGQVVGINTAIISSGQGLGFAIPINMVTEVLAELKATGEVARGWLGVAVQAVTPEIARAVGLSRVRGAMVSDVYPGNPAAAAGIRSGDIIMEVNGKNIGDPHDLTRAIGSLKPGSKVAVRIWRDERNLDLEIELDRRSDEKIARQDKDAGPQGEVKDRLGLTVGDVTPELASRYDLPDEDGVVVLKIDPEGSAVSGGIKQGDVIREVNRNRIKGVTEYLAELDGLEHGKTVLLLIFRDGRPLYLAMDVE